MLFEDSNVCHFFLKENEILGCTGVMRRGDEMSINNLLPLGSAMRRIVAAERHIPANNRLINHERTSEILWDR
ncbi:hypothetical protein L1987_31565 [Smallanthus sonchifolius]|uniref:Uncharacterized protein n=1 Tax=Smallanthus sonchifolius TaxID=185202 RepID=A0ACB9I5Y2_9ASTR|nr:hypothetical protein L1987_31565 [Smallanthus sonchifolius]